MGEQRQEGTVLTSWFLCWRDMELRWPVPAETDPSHLCQRPEMSSWLSLGSSLWYPRSCTPECSACEYPVHGQLWRVLRVRNLLCCLRRLAKQINNRRGRELSSVKLFSFIPILVLFPFQRQWSVWIKHSFQTMSLWGSCLSWWSGLQKKKYVFKKTGNMRWSTAVLQWNSNIPWKTDGLHLHT